MEPRAPDPKRRLAVMKRLSDAGIPVRVMASPMTPELSDHELEAILQEGVIMGPHQPVGSCCACRMIQAHCLRIG
jgi:DNA repair photolyase